MFVFIVNVHSKIKYLWGGSGGVLGGSFPPAPTVDETLQWIMHIGYFTCFHILSQPLNNNSCLHNSEAICITHQLPRGLYCQNSW